MTLTNVLNIIGIFLRDAMMIVNYLIFGKYLLKGKIRKHPALIIVSTVVLAIVSFLGELYVVPWDNGSYETTSILSTLMFIVSMIIFIKEIPKGQFVFLAFCYTGIVDMTYTYFEHLVPKEHYIECLIYFIIYLLITCFILFSIKNSPTNIFPEVIATIPNWMFWTVIIFSFTKYYTEVGDFQIITEVLTPISALSVICCVIYFMYKIFHLTYQQNEILKQMHEQKEFSEKMLTGDENLRKFRHDYRNHMIVINALMESGRTDRAREYLNAMNSDIDSTINKISTGNFITDAIINNKAIVAAKENAKIKFSGQIPENGIADDDLCTIIANIVDNAIEAVTKLESDKTVRIEAAMRNGIFLLNVSNPVIADIKIRKDGTIKTTKKNHHEHGIGMKNVQKVVKKYGGTIDVSCENKLFNVAIMMKPTL